MQTPRLREKKSGFTIFFVILAVHIHFDRIQKSNIMSNSTIKTLRDSAAMRWTALLLLALAMFCSYIFMDILSPIKDLMQETRGWDSTAFGTMQGSEVFLNVFVFFLIFAGIILDKMGVRFTAVLSAGVMLVGAIIKWYAVSESQGRWRYSGD